MGIFSIVLLAACASVFSHTIREDGVFGLGTKEAPRPGNFLKLLEPNMGPQSQVAESDSPHQDVIEGVFHALGSASDLRALKLSMARLDISLIETLELRRDVVTDMEFPDELIISGVDANIRLFDDHREIRHDAYINMEHRFASTTVQCTNDAEDCRVYELVSSAPLVIASASFFGDDLQKLRDLLTLGDDDKIIRIALQFYGEYRGKQQVDSDHFQLRPSYYDHSILTFSR